MLYFKNMQKIKKAFTLIELLVVISIIAILTGIMVVGLNSIRYKGFDATRLSDLHNLEIALETYKSVNGVYPDAGTQGTANYVTGLDPFISNSKLPIDPQKKHDGTNGYVYTVASDKKTYCFYVKNTVYNAKSQKDLQHNVSDNTSWRICHGREATNPTF
jgi:prepilin-type N-terminal cleavage/methylation domain-containing protein